jgi:predicted nucleotidyltransferase
MTTRQEVIGRLRSLKGELATRYDVREIGIFGWSNSEGMRPDKTQGLGAVARGESDTQSDIDLLVEFGPGADLITYIGLWQYLEDTFGMKIDLVTKGGLRSDMREKVMQDLVFV